MVFLMFIEENAIGIGAYAGSPQAIFINGPYFIFIILVYIN